MSPQPIEQPKIFSPEDKKTLFYRSQVFVVMHALKKIGETLRPSEQVSQEHNAQSDQWIANHSADYRRFFDDNADLICSLIDGCANAKDCPQQVEEITRQFEQYEQTHH